MTRARGGRGAGPAGRSWVAGVAILLLVSALLWSWQKTRLLQASATTCASLTAGDVDGALLASEDLDFTPPFWLLGGESTLLDAGECRARALNLSGHVDEGLNLLDGLVRTGEASGWLPAPDATAALIETRAEEDPAGALALAARAADRWPEDPDLARIEWRLSHASASVVDRIALAERLRTRATRLHGDPALDARLGSAKILNHAGRHAEVVALLDPEPWPSEPDRLTTWAATLGDAISQGGDQPALAAWRDRWAALGAPAQATLFYAIYVSTSHLRDPVPTCELLRVAVADPSTDIDPRVRGVGWARLVGCRLGEGRVEEARAIWAEHRAQFDALAVLDGQFAVAARREGVAQLHFIAPGRGELRVATRGTSAPWEPFASFPSSGAPVAVSAEGGPAGVRWVWRDALGAVRASGVADGLDGERIVIAEGAVRAAAVEVSTKDRPFADGRRRVWVVVLDCGDWRILRHLREREELPAFARLEAEGWSAALRQEPAFTAAAMASLTRPLGQGGASFPARILAFGDELAGLASVGRNPLAGVAAILPDRPTLFDALGSGEGSAANMLFAHGNIDSGRNAEVTGPNGLHRTLDVPAPVTRGDDVVARFPALASARARLDYVAGPIEQLGARFDDLDHLVANPPADALLLRVEPTDLLTHALYGEAAVAGQDDGIAALFDVYRYADQRLGRLMSRLDGDDVLVVMSDHGIRTPVEHDPAALFFAWGAGVPAGRATGQPALAGVPRVIAGLRGLSFPTWPDSGVAPWALR